jgi:iron complex outermembrane receptor protein
MLRTLLLAGVATTLIAQSAWAQTGPGSEPKGPAPAAEPPPQDFHEGQNQEIVVTGFRQDRGDLLSGVSVVSGAELTRELRPTIGETLARQPGVSATSFGPNASRPILRGFQGERVRVLTDGIGSLDVSNTSVDHAVAINPLTAERIEVLRGPSALLFGSAAIGGVVNVIDARIPRRAPEEFVHVDGLLTYGTAANERSGNAALDVPLGGRFVAHLDGNYSKTGDLRVGGFLLSPALRAQALASGDADIRELASLRGRLPNSAGRTSDVAAGLAWIDGQNNLGFSINRFDSLYGIPIRFSLDPASPAEAARIDLHQKRADIRAEFDLGEGVLDLVRMRGGYSDYRHSELEESGEAGTTFFNQGYEGRLEFVQSTRKGWGGGFGAQYYHRRLDTVGEEKSLPVNTTDQFGLFALQSYGKGILKAELGGRYERQRVAAEADVVIGNPDLSRSFDAFSGSAGASLGSDRLRAGLNLSHSERAPSAEELYVNGPHPGTQAFEVGDPDLALEKSNGVELTLHGSGDGFSLSASAYRIWFSDYIYEEATGAVVGGLPVFRYRQADARYLGFEAEGSARVAKLGDFAINVDALADYVRATIRSVGPAPRIPPLRILGGIEAQSEPASARLEVERVTGQSRLALLETPTRGFTMVNASISLQPLKNRRGLSVTLSANNLFDVNARRHASFLKDYSPLAGRDLRLSARFSF